MGKCFAVAIVFGALLRAQQPPPAVEALMFDVASIKPNNSGAVGESVRFHPPSGRVTMTNVTLQRLVRQAYQLQESQLTGGPDWIGSDHFDIVASSEQTNLSPPQKWMMIKALILERFKLKVHTESKEQSVFALVLARKDGTSGDGPRRTAADCAAMTPPTAPQTWRSDLVEPSSAAADRPADNGVSIFTALQEQLGLKLDSQKSAVDVLVIESAEKPVE